MIYTVIYGIYVCVFVHWGVARTTARRADDVHAMMMGSLTDDQIRQSRLSCY